MRPTSKRRATILCNEKTQKKTTGGGGKREKKESEVPRGGGVDLERYRRERQEKDNLAYQ